MTSVGGISTGTSSGIMVRLYSPNAMRSNKFPGVGNNPHRIWLTAEYNVLTEQQRDALVEYWDNVPT